MRDSEFFDVLIGGCDERHLEQNLNLFRSNLTCNVQADTPQVGYRETICKAVKIVYNHRKQTGGNRQFATVEIAVAPLEDNSPSGFESKVKDDAIPKISSQVSKKAFELSSVQE